VRRAILLLGAVALATGCSTVQVAPSEVRPLIEVPTAPHDDIVTAELDGRLRLRGRCLVVERERDRRPYLLIWPPGTRFNGSAVVPALPQRPERTIPIGARVRFSGDMVPWDELGHMPFMARYRPACDFTPFFIGFAR